MPYAKRIKHYCYVRTRQFARGFNSYLKDFISRTIDNFQKAYNEYMFESGPFLSDSCEGRMRVVYMAGCSPTACLRGNHRVPSKTEDTKFGWMRASDVGSSVFTPTHANFRTAWSRNDTVKGADKANLISIPKWYQRIDMYEKLPSPDSDQWSVSCANVAKPLQAALCQINALEADRFRSQWVISCFNLY